jgi:hypothetical protein
MGCALYQPDEYPDYLKIILKRVNLDVDKETKKCACELKSPVSDDGCAIVDQNEKIGAFPTFFPYCFNQGLPPYPDHYIKVNLATMMKIYWYRKFTVTANGFLAVGCYYGNADPVVADVTTTFTDKDLLCGKPFITYNSTAVPNYFQFFVVIYEQLYQNDKDFYFNFYVLAQDGWFFTAPNGDCAGYGCECGTFKVKLEGQTLGTQKMCMTTVGCGDGSCHPGSLSIELNIEPAPPVII